MNSMPFRQLKSFFKILIGVQYERRFYKFQFAELNTKISKSGR